MMKIRPLLLLSIVACTMVLLAACQPQSPAPAATPPAADGPSGAVVDEAAPASGQHAPLNRLRASGNEPFWSVKVDGNVLTYTTPEMQPGTRMTAERHVDPDGVRFSGSDGDTPFELSLKHGQCQDTMSGEMFEYTSSFTYGDRELTGCAGGISE